ncbi:MAG TPA: UvrD-helicase domain-containing protein [Ktedonobacterales bacterium]|jgi:DNA helicase-2/ATP-dependent DNA helicase PcrA
MTTPREETKLDLLAGLNQPQQEAVTHGEGPLLILAGPGSGKTRVITHRIAYLLRERGVPPWSVLAVTFTNKAAREMRERVNTLVGTRARDLTISTFHTLCSRILRRESEHYSVVPKNFAIFDDDDQLSLAKQAVVNLRLNDKQYQPRSLLSAISRAKNDLLGPLEFAERVRKYYDEVVSRVYKEYQRLLQQNNAVDFDDLILLTYDLWRKNPQILERYQARFRFLHVDEFQDTNIAQYRLMMLLAKGMPEHPSHRNICVVGDEDQGIYSWRGADIRNILEFERDFPEARVILLEQNYRSTQPILDAARQVVQQNLTRKDKRLWTERKGGALIRLHEAYNEEDEGQWVANEIRRTVNRGEAKYKDFAVMYRTNAQSRALEEQFIRAGVAYQVVGSRRFYERAEIKDMLAYLRLLLNPADTFSLRRIINLPNRKIGPKTLDELLRWADKQHLAVTEALRTIDEHPTLPTAGKRALANFYHILTDLLAAAAKERLPDLLDRILDRTGYRTDLQSQEEEGEERLRNILELRRVAMDYEEIEPAVALPLFLEQVALVGGSDLTQTSADDRASLAPENQDAVTLITLHAAKGLEFPVVFMVGVEEGILPHSRALMDLKQLEEERRLAYVGMTRAMRQLYLVRVFRRSFYGSAGEAGGGVMEPSRFIQDIATRLLEVDRDAPPENLRPPGYTPMAYDPNRKPPKPPAWGKPSKTWAAHYGTPNGVDPWATNGANPANDGDESARPMRLAKPREPGQAKFVPGDRVQHRFYGVGRVMACAAGSDAVEVDFGGHIGKKMLDINFAKLELLEDDGE